MLDGATSVTISVAFVQSRGVHLIEKELRSLHQRGIRSRMLVTTTFSTTNEAALTLAHNLGAKIRVLNPNGSTFHPKVFLAESDRGMQAVVGSANLTGGLASNIEIGVWMDDEDGSESMERLKQITDKLWNDPRAQAWQPSSQAIAGEERFSDDLLQEIIAVKNFDPVVLTLGPSPKENRLIEITPTEVLVETERSRQHSGSPSPIPAWMFNLAWDYLRVHGSLTNRFLLNELRVHRSSAICAILARFPMVDVMPTKVVTLQWRGKP